MEVLPRRSRTGAAPFNQAVDYPGRTVTLARQFALALLLCTQTAAVSVGTSCRPALAPTSHTMDFSRANLIWASAQMQCLVGVAAVGAAHDELAVARHWRMGGGGELPAPRTPREVLQLGDCVNGRLSSRSTAGLSMGMTMDVRTSCGTGALSDHLDVPTVAFPCDLISQPCSGQTHEYHLQCLCLHLPVRRG